MKLGGHQTFPPRPGWLTKGLLHLRGDNPGPFSSPATADSLGVGIKMSKSIEWWLGATGLAAREWRGAPLALTEFGKVVADGDPFMSHLGTLWMIHASALTCGAMTSLHWFLSPDRPKQFGRSEIEEDFSRAVERSRGKAPSSKGVKVEVSTIMRTYAVPVPPPTEEDPEENLVSPFHRLRLFSYIAATERFERTGNPTPAPPEALGLVLSALCTEVPSHDVKGGILLNASATGEAVLTAGASFGLGREQILALASRSTAKQELREDSHAGERIIVLESAAVSVWASRFYSRLQVTDRKAA